MSENLTDKARAFPEIIQGGMGVRVSSRELAGEVAGIGEMGVISGTAIGLCLVRQLQDGDPDGSMRLALAAYPDQETAEKVIHDYFIDGGRSPDKPYKTNRMLDQRQHDGPVKINMLGAFAEVWTAKKIAREIASRDGREPGPVGMNLLTELQATLPSALYGAMLAEVDCVIMGAGIPHDIPEALGNLAMGRRSSTQFEVSGTKQNYNIVFDPDKYPLLRDAPKTTPAFLAIVASDTLAKRLSRSNVPPNGFVIERPTAAGHNAPPRGRGELDENNEPLYGARDEVNLEKIVELGLPFWLAGSYGITEGLQKAKEAGAHGIQVGSAFALCNTSGMDQELRRKLIDAALNDGIPVKTDGRASPTGYPFKVADIEGTMSKPEEYEARKRVCDLGFLRKAYAKPEKDGAETIGYRCASEPIETYVGKGGDIAATIGRKCLCNGLLATIQQGQLHKGVKEAPIITIGDAATEIVRCLVPLYGTSFSATDVVKFLHGGNTK